MDAGNNSDLGKGRHPRHTPLQVQLLEVFFKECPHPDENQRRQLSREIGLAPNRVKFWFQNKRNQTKVQNDRATMMLFVRKTIECGMTIAISAVMKNVICPTYDACPPVGEEARKLNVQKLRMENSLLKEMHERLSNEITSDRLFVISMSGIWSFRPQIRRMSVLVVASSQLMKVLYRTTSLFMAFRFIGSSSTQSQEFGHSFHLQI